MATTETNTGLHDTSAVIAGSTLVQPVDEFVKPLANRHFRAPPSPMIARRSLVDRKQGVSPCLWRLAICGTKLIPDRRRFRWTFPKKSCCVSMEACKE